MDHPKLGWIGRLLGQLRDARTGAEFLWPFIQGQYSTVMKQAAADLKLVNLAPYPLRHAGASSDLLFKYQPATDVKLRRRWKGDSSLRRYGEPVKAPQACNRLAPKVNYSDKVDANLMSIGEQQVVAVAPPAATGPPP